MTRDRAEKILDEYVPEWRELRPAQRRRIVKRDVPRLDRELCLDACQSLRRVLPAKAKPKTKAKKGKG